MDVCSVIFFGGRGASFMLLTAVNLLAACPPTAPIYSPQHRHNKEEAFWYFYANRSASVQRIQGLWRGSVLP